MWHPYCIGFVNVEFFLDVIESYLPHYLEEIEEYCTGEENKGSLLRGQTAVRNVRRIAADLRALLKHSESSAIIRGGYDELIKAFVCAHDEDFNECAGEDPGSFMGDFNKWKGS
jgi:hypothetical protein